MSTVNISLPEKQANYIDMLVVKYGFANRSEFIRSIIRLVVYKPDLVEEAATFPFVVPKEQSAKKIIDAFSKNNRYSKEFLKDLKEGLGESDYFSE
ncbi:MAG: ribbon-helix-helix domain-containing protein [Candidatus Roizmanbacteria bacterium]|nr:ribbon-helix-helix domain-containing protein [Candidatus Roizmanbacteria bacterium]MCR4312862.1 ribbon-helix-helix domain-containing protein [Candidatus Roizmanbacteria bacterium]